MEGKKTSACLILGGLGMAAVIAGFAAEATRTKWVVIHFSTAMCEYPSSPAYALGICAMVILCIIQIVFNITTGCACCFRRKSSPNEETPLNSNTATLEMIFVIVSWITFVVAFDIFLGATLLNAEGYRPTTYGNCVLVKRGKFSGASMLTLVCAGCGIGYINLVFKAPPVGDYMNGTEGQYGQQPASFIPVGQPQQQYGAGQVQLGGGQKQQFSQPAQYPPPPNPHHPY